MNHPASASGLRRRHFVLSGASAAVLAPFQVRAAGAAASPPIHMIIPFGPGGLADVTTRVTMQKLADKLGQQVIIENRPGAGGVVAATSALSAPHDGTTLILFANGTTIAKTLLKLPYDPQADFLPVSTLAYFDLNLLVKKDSPFADLQALLAEGRKRQLVLGAINPGSTQHLSAELFRSVAKVDASVIPFRTSGDVQSALMRGDIDLGFESYAALGGGIKAGLLRALATTGPRRTPWLPQVPTTREAGLPAYEVTGWNAVYAPRGTPDAVLARLNAAMRDVLAQPALQQRLVALGVEPRACTGPELAALFEHDRLKWAQVIRQANIKI